MDPSGLQCIICPGQPVFSDRSHLVTHLLSKAHVSHLYKLDLHSHEDADAAELRKAFNTWFESNGYRQLVRVRESAKEDRKNKKKPSGMHTVCSITEDTTDSNSTLPGFIDPRLADPTVAVKQEAADAGHSQNATTDSAPPDANQPVTPKPRRAREKKRLREKASVNPSAHKSESKDSALDFQGDEGEEPQLKGVYWSGMGIFDAAPKEKRRMRNQKKDASVLKWMEESSRGVQPTEQVFSPTGDLLKERFISGNVEDDSPVKGEMPIPKKGTLGANQGMLGDHDSPLTGKASGRCERGTLGAHRILRDQDPNLPRNIKNTKRKRTDVEESRSYHDKSEEALDTQEPEGFTYRKAPFGSGFDKEYDEIGYTAGAFRKHQTGFTVFNDDLNEGDGQVHRASMVDYQGQVSRAPQGTLAPAQLEVFREQSTISYGSGHMAQIALGYYGHSTQTVQGNENIDPNLDTHDRNDITNGPFTLSTHGRFGTINGRATLSTHGQSDTPNGLPDLDTLNTHGQLDHAIWNSTSPVMKRSNSDMESFPSYHYNHGTMDTGATSGYQVNPLHAPDSRTTDYDYPLYGENCTLTWTANSQDMSSPGNTNSEATWPANSPDMSSEALAYGDEVIWP